MSDYYCWMQYYDSDTSKQSKSDEIRYAQGHHHGVQPTDADWENCLDDLVGVVNGVRANANPPLAALPDATISAGAEKKTRSAH